LSIDERAQILNLVAQTEHGVREIIQKLRWKPSRVIFLLEQMKDEGLIELQKNNTRNFRRGRPKKIMTCTSLGYEFLEAYLKLRMKPLRARKEDLEHAVKDALYTERLVANGHSPFKLFMELNTIAHNIKISSEASRAIRR
jgi:DNA-binding PadR family transcriptional regulator